ncbi:CD5 antigen-like [Babylonia areolata]|uniref:CD5 antigen-like n=1 Tax=Babylonia areolata TaxID=304850 RepID=UPI003FD227FE
MTTAMRWSITVLLLVFYGVAPSQQVYLGSPVYYDDPRCRGTETNMGHCSVRSWIPQTSYCRYSHYSHFQDIGVRCYQHTVRLRPQHGDFGGSYGAIEVLETSRYWFMTLCDSSWDDNDARAVCKTAGYIDGKALCCGRLTRDRPHSRFYSGNRISCPANATSFASCGYLVYYGRKMCWGSVRHLASVICYHQPRTSVDNSFAIRINSTSVSPSVGRVEVRHMGVWGGVCSISNAVASVACREINGGRGGGVALTTPPNDGFHGSIWATQLNCTGNETSLAQCVMPPWGAPTTCSPMHSLCYTSAAPVVQLVGGSDGSHGRVEVVVDGSRYTVCDDSWSNEDATVVCRNLGYGGGVAIKCRGNEGSLLQCRSDGWLRSNDRCNTHLKDASVYCHGHILLRQGDHNNGIVTVN